MLLTLLASFSPTALASPDVAVDPKAEEARERLALSLEAELMAPCCWQGVVADHDSPASARV